MIENIGAYIHFPFCVKKCYYCDFYSIANLSGIDGFVDSLVSEIEMRADLSDEKYSFDTVFLGGGTPSLLSAPNMERVLNALSKYYGISSGAEISMECNPNSADADNFKDYRSLGVNRISIGVQTFIPKELDFLQRIHTPDEAEKAIRSARTIFDNLNLDLMFAIPGQTLETLTFNIEKALELETDHVSAYSLIFEEGTGLYKALQAGKVKQADEDVDSDFYFKICDTLKSKGFEHYEVSNFSKPGKRCRHNLKYWHGEPYAAFGPSAHGYVNNQRYKNYSDLKEYKDLLSNGRIPTESVESISAAQAIDEYIFLGLRAEGIADYDFKSRFNIDLIEKTGKLVESLVKEHYAKYEDGIISLTSKGYWICDEITLKFMTAFE